MKGTTRLATALLIAFSGATQAAESETVTMNEHPIALMGGARCGGGDSEMDTNEGDIVEITLTSDLKIDTAKNRVVLHVAYSCEETKGDNTKLCVEKAVEVYRPPQGWAVKEIQVAGDGQKISIAEKLQCQGGEHGFKAFSAMPDESYWSSASFKVDSANGDDGPHVGVKGELSLTIIIEKP